jgi:hypothetical protein
VSRKKLCIGKIGMEPNFNYFSVVKNRELDYFHLYLVLSLKVGVTIGSEGEKKPLLIGREKSKRQDTPSVGPCVFAGCKEH